MKILFYGKKDDWRCDRALAFLKDKSTVHAYIGKRGEKLPDSCGWIDYDILISYLSPWVIPDYVLSKVKDALNFHPGSPEYPGIGCTNQAIYNNAEQYGVVCHRMTEKVDDGDILYSRSFMVYGSDSVWSLTQRAYDYMLEMFYSVMDVILSGKALPPRGYPWKRKPYTRKELNDLYHITPEMDYTEMSRRIKSTTYPGYPGAYVEINGVRFNKGEGG